MYRKEFRKIYSIEDLIGLARDSSEVLAEFTDTSLPVQFSFSPTPTLDTAFLVTIANIYGALVKRGFETISFGYPEDISTMHRFWADIGLSRLIDGEPLSQKAPKNRFFELTAFRSVDANLISDFSERFAISLPKIPDLTSRLERGLNELMENVRVHSQCPWGGYLCGYMNSSTKVFRFSVADFGIGIPGSLKDNPAYVSGLDDDALIREATQYDVTGPPGERKGSGLPYMFDFVEACGGILRIYSGNGCLRFGEGAVCLRSAEFPYPGTLFTIDIPAA